MGAPDRHLATTLGRGLPALELAHVPVRKRWHAQDASVSGFLDTSVRRTALPLPFSSAKAAKEPSAWAMALSKDPELVSMATTPSALEPMPSVHCVRWVLKSAQAVGKPLKHARGGTER